MPTSSRRFSRRSRRTQGALRRVLIVCATAALFVAAISTAVRQLTDDAGPPPEFPADFASSEFVSDPASFHEGQLLASGVSRPVYMHSVVPGGVYSGSELRNAIRDDAVVAAHYRELDQSRLRTEVVQQDRYVHVSYRKGDQIFWTKNKVLLRQGETIMTDGKTQVRARCGNCISEEPLLPTSENEPEVIEFDKLVEAPATRIPATPPIALVAPGLLDPLGAGLGLASPEVGPIEPLAAGRFGNGVAPPLAALNGDPTPPVDIPPVTPGSPGSPNPPGADLPPFTPFPVPSPPGGDDPAPLVPPEYFPPPEIPPLDVPVPPGDPVAVPEPGTLLLIGGGVAWWIRRRRSYSSEVLEPKIRKRD